MCPPAGSLVSGKIQVDAQGLLNGTAESLTPDRTDPQDESAFVNISLPTSSTPLIPTSLQTVSWDCPIASTWFLRWRAKNQVRDDSNRMDGSHQAYP
jgi:hypothetical protein